MLKFEREFYQHADLVCQSGPGSWPSNVYAEAAIYPMANSAAQVSLSNSLYMSLTPTSVLLCDVFVF